MSDSAILETIMILCGVEDKQELLGELIQRNDQLLSSHSSMFNVLLKSLPYTQFGPKGLLSYAKDSSEKRMPFVDLAFRSNEREHTKYLSRKNLFTLRKNNIDIELARSRTTVWYSLLLSCAMHIDSVNVKKRKRREESEEEHVETELDWEDLKFILGKLWKSAEMRALKTIKASFSYGSFSRKRDKKGNVVEYENEQGKQIMTVPIFSSDEFDVAIWEPITHYFVEPHTIYLKSIQSNNKRNTTNLCQDNTPLFDISDVLEEH